MSKWAYYNDIDPYVIDWCKNLARRGIITDGEFDTRSIIDVRPEDVRGFNRVHFFCGLAGWELALRLANWSDDPVWTGSCPCQPFSVAGKQRGTDDERHLWPEFHRLIGECRPPVVFGEQVASKAGRQWLAGVRADLEDVGYAVGAADLCAAGVGAPHIRQRLWFIAKRLANATDTGEGRRRLRGSGESLAADDVGTSGQPAGHGESGGGLGDTDDRRCDGRKEAHGGDIPDRSDAGWAESQRLAVPADPGGGGLANGLGAGLEGRSLPECERAGERPPRADGRGGGRLPDADGVGQSQRQECDGGTDAGELPSQSGNDAVGPCSHGVDSSDHRSGDGEPCFNDPWAHAGWIPGPDGKWRRVEPGIRLLAHGVPARVAKLRAFGNAIVPQGAAEFIKAAKEAVADVADLTR